MSKESDVKPGEGLGKFKIAQVIIAIIAIIFVTCLFPTLELMKIRQAENPNYPKLLDFWPDAVYYCILLLLIRYGSRYLFRDFYKWCIVKHDEKLEQRIQKFGFGAFKVGWYMYTTSFILRHYSSKPYLVPYMGGTGKWTALLDCAPHCSIEEDERYFYMLQMGFALHTTVGHILDDWRRDFWEMMIHHVVLISLLFFSWARNWIKLGMVILLIHDPSDIGIYWLKLSAEMENTVLIVIGVVYWFSTWFYLRHYALLRTLIFDWHIVWEYEQFVFDACFFYGLLWILALLHCLWSFMILKGFVDWLGGLGAHDYTSVIGKDPTIYDNMGKLKKLKKEA